MAYLTCRGDIDFSPVPGLISMVKVIPMEKGCAIGLYLHIRYIQTLLEHGNVHFKDMIGYG